MPPPDVEVAARNADGHPTTHRANGWSHHSRSIGRGDVVISDEHLAMLAASGITPEHAVRRGYETITDKYRLAELKIVTAARSHVPGLLVPLRRIDGSVWGSQYRPDNPRFKDGKSIKYETPWQQRNGLDVPPGVADKLGDPSVPLWITEGTKKADCGALHGLTIVALTGVWNWLCTNGAGGKVVLADWRDVALNGRRVVIAFDGDISRKEPVQKAAHALAAYLATKGATVEFLHLPDEDDKVGLDDYLMAGHTADDLWSLVKPHQPRATSKPEEPPAAPTQPSEPAGPPEDGAALLDDVYTYLGRFVAYPSGHAQVAHTLWIVHAHLMDCWESTPRIAFLSPEPGSGKTRALEVTEPLVPHPIHSVNVTSAYLFRKIAEIRPTLLYDEIDTVFGPKARDNEEIRGVINSGHRNGATAGRCVVRGKVIETEDLPSYCAVAMAGLNDLPDTIMDRSVIVRMRRRAPDEQVEPWRARINTPQAALLGARLAKWADGVRPTASEHWPDMPESITDRNADIWEALLTVADLGAGHWPQTARRSAVALVADARGGEPSYGVQLLRDIKIAYETRGRDSLSTVELLTDLRGMGESPWQTIGFDGKGLDTRRLAQRLAKYQVKSKNIRLLGSVLKGYERAQFEDAWRRYPAPTEDEPEDRPSPPSEKSATSATSATSQVNGGHRSGCSAADTTFTPPTGPDRCADCGWHVEKQGHRDGCQQSASGQVCR